MFDITTFPSNRKYCLCKTADKHIALIKQTDIVIHKLVSRW